MMSESLAQTPFNADALGRVEPANSNVRLFRLGTQKAGAGLKGFDIKNRF
jgi:hypothetical protein